MYIAARNAEKSVEAIRDLMAITGKEARFIQLDLADLKSVKKAASEFLKLVWFFLELCSLLTVTRILAEKSG